MKAVILAGGFGRRLRPVTYRYPKPMVPIKDKPFLEYMMNFLKTQGISEFILCLHYMAGVFIEYFGNGSMLGFKITYSIEKMPLGTGGAIKKVGNYLDKTFLVLNGDTYLNLDLEKILRFHRNNKGLGTIALVRLKSPARYGVVNVYEDWRITSFSEKAAVRESYVNAGVYIFENRILDYIPRNEEVSLEKDVLPNLLSKERICGFLAEGYFIDIGVPEDYHRFQMDVERGILG